MMPRLRPLVSVASAFIGAWLLLVPSDARAVYSCGGHNDDYNCGGYNPYPCCDNGGNCTWWAWDRACRNWNVSLPGWGNAKTWAQYAEANSGYTVLSAPVVGSIACRDVGTYGHVAWVTAVNGSTVTVTEMNCGSGFASGSRSHSYSASFFTGGFIVPAGTHPATCSTADGALIKPSDSSAVYYMQGGRRWWIVNEEIFNALGLSYDDLCVASPAQVEGIPHGPNIGDEGTMFLCPSCAANTNAVYRIDGGKRRHIANEWVLEGCLGLSLDDVFIHATEAFKALFPAGSTIDAECQPGASDQQACGDCGQRTRSCTSSCSWGGWSSCTGQGPCAPGEQQTSSCGRCGQQTRSCGGQCGWSQWSECSGQGACEPGDVDTRACGSGCGVQSRTCGDGCAWGAWGTCSTEAPCTQGSTESEACGRCGSRSRTCLGCAGWGQWGSCMGQGVCEPGASDEQLCPGGCASHTRVCSDACEWQAFGQCPADEVACDDDNPCTLDACASGACEHERRALCCADGAACPAPTATISYECQGGTCVPSSTGGCASASECADGDPCTEDRCDGGECRWTPIEGCCADAAVCGDGDACTLDTCGVDHRCHHEAPDCQGRVCSADGCCGDCPAGQLCDAAGACVEAGGACDSEHPASGRCDGDRLYACDEGRAVERDCASQGRYCGPASVAPLTLGCVSGCGAVSAESICVGTRVYYCDAGVPRVDDCAAYDLGCGSLPAGGQGCVQTCSTPCPPGTHCEDAACVSDGGEPQPPDQDASVHSDTAASADTGVGADAAAVSGDREESGCQGGGSAPVTPLWPLGLGLLGWLIARSGERRGRLHRPSAPGAGRADTGPVSW